MAHGKWFMGDGRRHRKAMVNGEWLMVDEGGGIRSECPLIYHPPLTINHIFDDH